MTAPRRSRVRRHLIAGLIVTAPLAATVFVLWWIFQLLDGVLGRFLYPFLGGLLGRDQVIIPGLGLLVLFLLLVGAGWAAERAIGGRVVAWWHDLLERIPLTRRIYGAAHRIVRTVFGEESKPFNKVVLIEWPSPGLFAIGFLSAPTAPDTVLAHRPGLVSVFMPTTPNPTTGFLVMLAAESVTEIDMTVDEAFTCILSGGAVRPDAATPSTVVSTQQPQTPA